jgi:hypothetical protein
VASAQFDSSDVDVAAVQGTQTGEGGTGVLGTGPANGVVGKSTGSGFSGVFGESRSGPGVSGSSTSSVGVDAKTKTGPAALRAIHSGNGPGVVGACHGDGFAGVFGESASGPGVSGSSTSSVGVDAKTKTGPAALRAIHSGNGPGVVGACHGDGFAGVFGESASGPGVSGSSTSSVGVDAKTTSGPAALRAIHAGGGFGVIAASESGIGLSAKGAILAARFEGNVAIVGGDCTFPDAADCAEDFDVAEVVEPGTVMVLGEEGKLFESDRAYDRRVAGIVSGAGSYKPGIILDRRQTTEERRPLALLGKAFCKVDATYASITVGDLLTTSPTLGHAMKAEDPFRAFGSVVGKALRPLKDGRGMIPILIALQ